VKINDILVSDFFASQTSLPMVATSMRTLRIGSGPDGWDEEILSGVHR
jgi:hypothetical protein